MAKRLYVGNLTAEADEGTLKTLFAEHGAVRSLQIMHDRETGTPKGFAFVEMETDQDAATAMTRLNGAEFQGLALMVEVAKPRPINSRRSSSGYGGSGFGGGGYGGGGFGGGGNSGWGGGGRRY